MKEQMNAVEKKLTGRISPFHSFALGPLPGWMKFENNWIDLCSIELTALFTKERKYLANEDLIDTSLGRLPARHSPDPHHHLPISATRVHTSHI